MSKTLKDKIRQKLIVNYGKLLTNEKIEPLELQQKINSALEEIMSKEHTSLSEQDKKVIILELVDELAGFGPIEKLLKDPAVTEIMINGTNKVYIERQGHTELADIVFDDENQVMYLVQKMLAPTRRHVDESYPYTEISLKDGSRVNIIIPPLALDGPTLTIRKFLKEIRKAEDLVSLGTLDKRMVDFLVAAIKAKVNIIFAGPTGAGKTTTLNVLSSYIPNEERIITIEDTAELHLLQDHVVRLESKHPSIEGKGEVTIRDLFKNSLRMRPDRIILGEIRGAEALDMLQAACSGHNGSLSVIHANSPLDVIYRIETMILTSGVPISLDVIHRQIAAAIHLIVQQEQLIDGSRKITHITQINGIKDGRVFIDDIFKYAIENHDSEGRIHGRWQATGVVPLCSSILEKQGVHLSTDIFKKD